MYIRHLDGPDHSWETIFVERFFGLKFDHYWFHREILTREDLDHKLERILEYLEHLEGTIDNPPKYGSRVSSWDSLVIAYQILGVLILQTGAILPKKVKKVILETTTWKYDKKRGWSSDPKIIRARKFYLKDFRKKIKNHKTGNKISAFVKYIDGIEA